MFFLGLYFLFSSQVKIVELQKYQTLFFYLVKVFSIACACVADGGLGERSAPGGWSGSSPASSATASGAEARASAGAFFSGGCMPLCMLDFRPVQEDSDLNEGVLLTKAIVIMSVIAFLIFSNRVSWFRCRQL